MQTAIDPATGKKIRSYKELSNKKLSKAIAKADSAFLAWERSEISERAELLRRAARVLDEEREALAMLITREMGKPLTAAKSELEKCAWVCLYYAGQAERYLRDEFVTTEASKSYIAYRPLGVLLGVMPWNFPFWQVFRFAAPNLMAGNAILLKHAPNVPGCAQAIASVFAKAGFPEHVFTNLPITEPQVRRVIEDRAVKGVTLTGSVGAGQAVAALAGGALKKTVLELGGSDPYLILEDADIGKAAHLCAKSRLLNSGQSCIGAKRFIVLSKVHKKFLAAFQAEMERAQMGDPLAEDCTIGPLARHDLRENLHRQVKASIKAGAKCIMGGKMPKGKGFFYPPTILTGVKKGMPAYSEELFGPVATVLRARDEQQAIKWANDTSFGLGAAVFTEDLGRGERIAREELRAGACFVNEMVSSDPRLPFGGINDSGYGRELGYYGLREFTNVKTVYVE